MYVDTDEKMDRVARKRLENADVLNLAKGKGGANRSDQTERRL